MLNTPIASAVLLGVTARAGLGFLPVIAGEDFGALPTWSRPPAGKRRNNSRTKAQRKGRAKAKAAHKARMAQKRKGGKR